MLTHSVTHDGGYFSLRVHVLSTDHLDPVSHLKFLKTIYLSDSLLQSLIVEDVPLILIRKEIVNVI